MSDIIFRIAKPSDAKQIAKVHYAIRYRYDVGIFAQMRLGFLQTYYKILLDDPYEIIVCAENTEKKQLIGFNSYTLDANEQMQRFRRNKIKLAMASIPSVICNPRLIRSLIKRYQSTNAESSFHYVNNCGVRGEFWGWDKRYDDPVGAMELNMCASAIIKDLGYKEIFFEVDMANKNIYKYHLKRGSVVIDTVTLPDGRVRVLMKKELCK